MIRTLCSHSCRTLLHDAGRSLMVELFNDRDQGAEKVHLYSCRFGSFNWDITCWQKPRIDTDLKRSHFDHPVGRLSVTMGLNPAFASSTACMLSIRQRYLLPYARSTLLPCDMSHGFARNNINGSDPLDNQDNNHQSYNNNNGYYGTDSWNLHSPFHGRMFKSTNMTWSLLNGMICVWIMIPPIYHIRNSCQRKRDQSRLHFVLLGSQEIDHPSSLLFAVVQHIQQQDNRNGVNHIWAVINMMRDITFNQNKEIHAALDVHQFIINHDNNVICHFGSYITAPWNNIISS